MSLVQAPRTCQLLRQESAASTPFPEAHYRTLGAPDSTGRPPSLAVTRVFLRRC